MDLSLSLEVPSPMEQQEEIAPDQELIIIGGGPAGFTAAVYAARADLKPLVLVGPAPGGQAATTEKMENFPGFPEGIGGQALASLIQEQAEGFGARLVYDEVIAVDFSQRPFKIKTYEREYTAQAVIIATGAKPRRLGVPGEAKFIGRGVSFCATCDGFFYRDKTVVVVGGGDSAMDESQFLSKFARKVYIVHRRDKFRATKHLVDRALANPKIEFILNTVVEEILGEDKVTGVRLRRVDTGEVSDLAADGVFVYIGLDPNTKLFEGQIALDDQKYIITDKRQRTNIPGVFAAGDVQDPDFRQVVIAAGTGAAAAIAAEHYLSEQAG
jgi:thioredoxin reductase (NADPH)